MEKYNLIAQWIGWPPIVVALILVGGLGIWFYKNRIQIQIEKYDLLEQKYQDSQKQTSIALVKELAETRSKLTGEIERLLNQSEQDTQKITLLKKELEDTNSQLESQRAITADIQEFLDDMVLPRDGKIRPDIVKDIQKTINTHNCIYIPIVPYYADREIDLASLTNNKPFTLEVVFPGMSHMYLMVYDSLNNHVGAVSNPYFGIYEKDYFVTLLYLLKFVPSEDVSKEKQYEGEAKILPESSFHGRSPINPEIFYLKVPFYENWTDG